MKGRPLLVTAALILRDDRILVAKRLPDSRFEPDKWEFPGGKVDFSEHPKEAMKRELQEEMGIEVEVGKLYDLASHVYDQNGMLRHVVILFYRCTITSGEPKPLDCQDIRWVSRDQLADLTFVEGDHPLMRKLSEDDGFWIRT
ncbi:MAG: (deoxy)nucleoside triphosphate pyrophosphohydrolase [Candidatus Thermoplasmatota archaeon]|nr:(deoxy)nucleoside triphosphate pyrophosphohydrolase [Candidatus Thermoplasmatota archaeon]